MFKTLKVWALYTHGGSEQMPHLQKFAAIRDFFLPPLGQFPAHSASWLVRYLTCCINRSRPPVNTAYCSKPPSRPRIRFLQLLQYSVKHFPARSTKNSLCSINHSHTKLILLQYKWALKLWIYKYINLLQYICRTMLFSMNCFTIRHVLYEEICPNSAAVLAGCWQHYLAMGLYGAQAGRG